MSVAAITGYRCWVQAGPAGTTLRPLGALNARPPISLRTTIAAIAPTGAAPVLCCSLPAGFASGVAPIVDRPAVLRIRGSVPGPAVAQRRDEFRAGRVAARLALSRLAARPPPSPHTPNAIRCGREASSVHRSCQSHSARHRGALEGFQGAGIDLEDATPARTALVGTVSAG